MYFVHWETGSCQAGNRNGGLEEFELVNKARERAQEIIDKEPSASITLIDGVEIT